MKAPRNIPDVVRQRQTEASDPDFSAFVAANAGSGKTHVLAQRVIRLLLNGVDPTKILCITFTKAAAANMANRVFDELRKWTALDDDALDRAMIGIGVAAIDPRRRAQARRLFAQALEAPGGLKVQTIHAFCTRLLHQFPFEANVAARFTVLDERSENDLLDRTSLSVLLEAAAAPESPLGRALATAIDVAADVTFREVVREAIDQRDRLDAWISAAGSVAAAIAALCGALKIAPDDTIDRVESDIIDGPHLPSTEWETVAAACAQGSASDQGQCERLRNAAALAGPARIEAYRGVFFTNDYKRRKSMITASLARQRPDLEARLAAEQARLAALLDRRRAVQCRDRTNALVTIANDVIARYRAEKSRRGLLDYDDLIERTLAMLATVTPSWVHYKLDLGIDHVLIDEAQDTSPKQWDIIKRLVAEFAAGAGARATKRTIFAVGDEKQSIFSFQGAAPRMFDAMRRHFKASFEVPELGWRDVRLEYSFRSGANVLDAVSDVFQRQTVYASITSDAQGIPPHNALPEAPPGLVEIWPAVKAEDRREIEGWDAPFDELAETSPRALLARKIANTLRVWIRQGRRAGDMLVLVRQRGPLFEAIIKALKERNIAVAGADRLKLTEHIAVEDLMSLGDALLLPDDDLALAVALKSPLFGLGDDQLFQLAWNRSGTLRAALNVKSADDLVLAAARARLERCAAFAQRHSPFAFYAWLLGAEQGRAAMLARLGTEAADALDEFLELALDYERRETPSLQGFLAWLRAAETEVKRDMDIARDEVRVMTVHGAKGLEAPIVILADTMTPPAGAHPPRLLPISGHRAPPDSPDLLVWAGAKVTDVPVVAAARQSASAEAENEYRRLLYVAMTRAAERLVVCGAEGARGRPTGCWYDLVVDALRNDLIEEPADDGDGVVLRYRRITREPVLAATTGETAPKLIELPPWLRGPAPAQPVRLVATTPSASGEALPQRAAGRADHTHVARALARGRLVHRLLQSLPDIPTERRVDAGWRFLDRAGAEFSAPEREAFLREVLALLDNGKFASLFAPGSRAEVPIIGRIHRHGRPTLAVSGQIDRLADTPDAILIADYKTNRPAPSRLEQVPHGYVRQLALYRHVLATLYPSRPVRAALIWTDTSTLMEIPSDLLDQALQHVTSA
jgi:ATP-dependent helicase/nuclease subunit A